MRAALDVASRVLWFVALMGSVLGGSNFVAGWYGGKVESPERLAALAAECMAHAVLPYVAARGWDELMKPEKPPA